MKKVILLNALPLNAFPAQSFNIKVTQINIEELKALITGKTVINFVRHPATVSLLSGIIGVDLTPTPGIYTYSQDDEIIVVTLKTPQRGQEVQQLNISDLIIYKVEVM